MKLFLGYLRDDGSNAIFTNKNIPLGEGLQLLDKLSDCFSDGEIKNRDLFLKKLCLEGHILEAKSGSKVSFERAEGLFSILNDFDDFVFYCGLMVGVIPPNEQSFDIFISDKWVISKEIKTVENLFKDFEIEYKAIREKMVEKTSEIKGIIDLEKKENKLKKKAVDVAIKKDARFAEATEEEKEQVKKLL